MAGDGERQSWIAQVAVDQQARRAEMGEQRGEVLRQRRLALVRQRGDDADDLRPLRRQRKIDRDLGRAQRLGELRQRMVDRVAQQRVRRSASRLERPEARPSALSATVALTACSSPRKSRPRSSRTSAATRKTRSRYSRSAPRPPPTIAPSSNDSARIVPRCGAEGARGGVAAVITRASVTGKDCCCSAS